MSSSKPSTPLSHRHQFGVVEDAIMQPTTSPALPSRIPQPSPPQPLRRSLSLRLRTVDQPDNGGGSKFSSYSSNDSSSTIAQTSPTLLASPLKHTTSNSSTISSSKSLSFIGNDGMAHNGAANGQHHIKESPTATNGHHNHKFSPTSTVSPFPHRKQSGSHEHGMVSVFDFIFHNELLWKIISFVNECRLEAR